MMDHVINVHVIDKIAHVVGDPLYVCGNSDYTVKFDFDSEWAGHETKTARFVKNNKEYIDVVFTGDQCAMPILENTPSVRIGVYAGNLCTTTAALVNAKRSILCGSGAPADPHPDVYAQVMQKMDDIYGALPSEEVLTEIRTNRESAEAAANEAAESVEKATAVKNSIPDSYTDLSDDVQHLSDEIVDMYTNDFVYRKGVYHYTATTAGTYKSVAFTLAGWTAGKTYTCEIGSVENNASAKIASLETFDASGTRLQQVFVETGSVIKNSITLNDNVAEFRLVYRPSFMESIAAGTVVTYKNVAIYTGDMKQLDGYDGRVDLAAIPALWTQGATVASSNGNIAKNPDRITTTEYMSFPRGFVCSLETPYMMSVARYDKEHQYLGYDSINRNRTYTAEECADKLYRFSVLKSGATMTIDDLPEIGISFVDDAQNVASKLYAPTQTGVEEADNVIPDYFLDEIDVTADSTLAVTDAPCITFALVTDTHQNATEKTVRNIGAVDELVNFDSLIHLGDVMETMGDAQYFYEECYSEIEAYRNAVQSGKLYATAGNHDGYTSDGKNDVSLDNELYRTMFRVTDERTNTVRDGNRPYYYVDFAHIKVRIIFLSSKSYTMTDGVYKYVYGFNDEQVEWLLGVLENTQDGWSIMVCSHIPPIDNVLNSPTHPVGITGNNGQTIVDILRAWKNRTSVTFDNKTHDFSNLSTNKFIAWLCGHIHGDMIKVYQDLTFVTVTAVAAFVPSWEMPEGGSFVSARTENTVVWDSWNSCVLRPDENKLYLFRFGAGDDMVVNY